MFDYVESLAESLAVQSEIDAADERNFILASVRAVFGDDVEVIEFEPYDDEGNTISKRGN